MDTTTTTITITTATTIYYYDPSDPCCYDATTPTTTITTATIIKTTNVSALLPREPRYHFYCRYYYGYISQVLRCYEYFFH